MHEGGTPKRASLRSNARERRSNMPTGKLLAPALLFWLALTSLNVPHCQAQNLRAATAASYIERGNEWFAKREYARAEADFTLAVATDPNNAEAYYNRATARDQLGKLAESLQDYDRA